MASIAGITVIDIHLRAESLLFAIVAALFLPSAFADDEIFEVTELTAPGRVVAAQFADFDGDGSKDLMVATLDGIPPDQSRAILVFLQSANGTFPAAPSHGVKVPERSAVFDIADLRGAPGDELILLRPEGLTVMSLADDSGKHWNYPVDGPSTLGAADDERGFERFRLVYDDFGDEPRIIVPQLGAVSILTADGALVAQLDGGRRANYFVASRGELLSVESDLQLYFDAPKISVGDIDGDGSADILAATRHELRVFLQDNKNGFPTEPSYSIPLGLIDEQDFTRGTGSVITTAQDIDADGRLDLMISHIEGAMADTATRTRIFFNRDGGWDLAAPDDEFQVEGSVTSSLLMNIDRDDALELVRIQVKFSVLEIVELLLTREVDTQIFVHRLQPDGRFGEEPWSRRKIGTKISFETFRPRGFMPRAEIDLNADGMMDFITSANGKGIEVFLGSARGPLGRRTAIQDMPTNGIIDVDDINDDGLDDFVLYDPQSREAIVRVGLNLGTLPTNPD